MLSRSLGASPSSWEQHLPSIRPAPERQAQPTRASRRPPSGLGFRSLISLLWPPSASTSTMAIFKMPSRALTASMNKHGGIDGRKIVPFVTLDNPANTTSGMTNCSQLTEDDHVFVVVLPVYPDCYQVTHDTPVIDGTLPGTLPASAAPDFSLTPPDTAYDPIELAALSKRGVFKDKKVGVYYGTGIDAPEARAVESDLKKLHVDVDQVAGAFAPATDTVAVDQQTQTIALKFKNDGVNEVISVGGSGPTDWARGLKDIESTYKPPWIATSVTALGSEVAAAKGKWLP